MAHQITTILIDNLKDEQTYGVYQMDERGICWDQELFSYPEKRDRSAAYAKAQKTARDWAAEHKAKMAEGRKRAAEAKASPATE